MKCVCASLSPGITVRPPASMTLVFSPLKELNSDSDPTARMRSPLMAIASPRGLRGSSVLTRALTISVSAGSCTPLGPQPLSAASPTLPLRKSRREPIPHLHVFRLEFDARSLGLRQQQRRKVLLGHALPDHLLQHVARNGGERHRDVEFAPRVQAQVEILAQQLRRKRDMEVEVHQRRRLITREHRTHYALVEEVEE